MPGQATSSRPEQATRRVFMAHTQSWTHGQLIRSGAIEDPRIELIGDRGEADPCESLKTYVFARGALSDFSPSQEDYRFPWLPGIYASLPALRCRGSLEISTSLSSMLRPRVYRTRSRHCEARSRSFPGASWARFRIARFERGWPPWRIHGARTSIPRNGATRFGGPGRPTCNRTEGGLLGVRAGEGRSVGLWSFRADPVLHHPAYFEALQTGGFPVTPPGECLPPGFLDWSSCSRRIADSQVSSLPSVLREREDEAERELERKARSTWGCFLSPGRHGSVCAAHFSENRGRGQILPLAFADPRSFRHGVRRAKGPIREAPCPHAR